jgi:hypothetical protein
MGWDEIERSWNELKGEGCCPMNLPLVSMREALRRPEYFGAVLAGDSWANWRVLLVAIAGEGLDEAEAGAFKGLSGRTGAPTEAQEPRGGRPGRLVSRMQRLQTYPGAGREGAATSPFRNARPGRQSFQFR